MAEFNWKTDHDPRHYAFERRCQNFYAERESAWDRFADRVVVVLCIAVIALILGGVLR